MFKSQVKVMKGLLQMGAADVGVAVGTVDAGVAEQLLNDPQIGAII